MGIIVLFFLLWLAVVYLPFAMGSWRAVLALCAVYLLFGGAVRWGVVTFTAAEVPAFLVFLGDFWLDFVVPALPVPIAARAVVLSAKSLGLGGKGLIALNIVALLALPGFWGGMAAYMLWEGRPPPEECTARPILLTLSSIEGAVRWNSAINLYVGPDLPEDARYLFSPAGQRRICSETANGTERLQIAALSVKLRRTPPKRCTAADVLPWEQALCDAGDDATWRALPEDVDFFDPNGIRLGYFSIPRAVTDESYAVASDERLVSTRTADAGTVTAVCQKEPYSNGQISCVVRSKVADGIGMSWEIYARPEDVPDRLLQADTFTSMVCTSIFDLPGCREADLSAP